MTERASYSSTHDVLSLNDERMKASRTYVLTLNAYLLLALAFVLHLPESVLVAVGLAAILSSIYLMHKSLIGAIAMTVLATHLGPILRISVPPFGMINLGDLYLALLLMSWLSRHVTRPIHWGPASKPLVALLLLLVIGVPFVPQLEVALPGYLNLLQFAVVYLIVINEVRKTKDIELILTGIGWAVLVSALLHIAFYVQGMSLGLTELENEKTAAAIVGQAEIVSFVKTSFFFVSFQGSCAAAMAIAASMALGTNLNWKLRGLWMVIYVSAMVSALVAGSRTAVLAGLICTLLFLFIFGFDRVNSVRRRWLVNAGVAFVGIVTAVVLTLNMLLAENQRDALLLMAVGDVDISFGERLVMWAEAFNKIAQFPIAFIFGVGPDVIWRGGHIPVVRDLMYVRGLAFQPPSFHNFYLDIIFTLGFASFLILGLVTLSTIRNLVSIRGPLKGFARVCLFGIAAWLLVWMTHATGWSKPVLIVAVLFALAHVIVACQSKVRMAENRLSGSLISR